VRGGHRAAARKSPYHPAESHDVTKEKSAEHHTAANDGGDERGYRQDRLRAEVSEEKTGDVHWVHLSSSREETDV
jgi:hypothetical protein